jgi:hypothetical protein
MDSSKPLDQQTIFRTWLPLAASWLLMGAELPLLSAVVARLSDPDIHLAAYSGIVFPLALVIESPIIMLLTASTALSRNARAYKKMWRMMTWVSVVLTVVHVAIAFTPLYDFIAQQILNVPKDIIEPGRIGLQIMTPWTWAIAHRRFNQGVLIRFGQSAAVGWGTAMRLVADVVILGIGFALHEVAGIVVATAAVAAGVLAEAAYIHWKVQAVINGPLREAKGPAITQREVILFYLPIAFAPTIGLLGQPMLTGAMSRMDVPMLTLAVWPTVNSLIFMLRAAGIAYTEVVVALLDRPGGLRQLRRFTMWLSLALSVPLLVLCTTPLIDIWFDRFIGLRPELAALGKSALWFAVLMPPVTAWGCYFEGLLIHHKRSAPVTEAVVFFIVTLFGFLFYAVQTQSLPGLNAAVCAMTLGGMAQTLWLWRRSHGISQDYLAK